MKFYRAAFISVCIVCWGASFISCGDDTRLLSISATPISANVPVGATQQFTAVGNYSDASTKDITTQITWSSSNPAVASINANGLATALSPGTTTISASQENIVSLAIVLTVNTATLTAISVAPPTPTVLVGATQQFTANGSYSDSTSFNLTSLVSWQTSDSSVATVNSAGLATAVSAPGTAIISASYRGVLGSTAMTVSAVPLTSITVVPAVNGSVTTLPLGITEQFKAKKNGSDAAADDITRSVTWRSSNTGILTVDAAGLVTPQAAGQVIITATSGTISGTFDMTVTNVALNSIVVSPPNATIAVGGAQNFSATAAFADGTSYLVTPQATWAAVPNSAASGTATIDSNGVATGWIAGVDFILISATLPKFQGTSGTARLTVQ